MGETPQVTDDQAASRFVASAGGPVAELIYRRRGDRFVLVHTGVPAELEGRGVGGELIMAAVKKAVADGLTVVPLCPFARDWLKRHPDVAATVKIDFG